MKANLRRRKRLCLEIAEHLQSAFSLHRTEWDTDQAARIIESCMPSTRDESLAEAELFDENRLGREPVPASCVLQDLRNALGLGREISLVVLMQAAVERIKKAKE